MNAVVRHLRRNEAVNVDPERLTVLDELRPDPELEEELESLFEEGAYDLLDDTEPVDAGNTVNARSWGWFRTVSANGDGWQLLPLDFQAACTNVVAVSAWQTQSMTGAVLSGGCAMTDVAALAWSRGDEGYDLLEVRYGALDLDDVVVEIAQAVLGEGDAVCPDIDEHGWEIDFYAHPDTSKRAVSEALGIIWRPCGERGHDALHIGDTSWESRDNRWWPVPT